MNKTRNKFLIISFAILASLIMVTAIFADGTGQPPAPYAGLKNPFAWDDTTAQQAGKQLYQPNCVCHGLKGNSLTDFDFSTKDFPLTLQASADYYFWAVSEGALSRGMPGFKSSLSENERWQILTYMSTLASSVVVPPPTTKPPSGGETITLTAPNQGQAGHSITLTAVLRDKDGKAIEGATVKFLVKVSFFATGLMEVGEAATNTQGNAVFDYIPRIDGDVQIVADYLGTEATADLTLAAADTLFYQAEAGMKLPTLGKEIFVPSSAQSLGPMSDAPVGGFRLPGGLLSWLLLLVFVMMVVWATYFRIFFELYRIPAITEEGDIQERLLPIFGMLLAVFLGILMVAMFFHGPFTHFNLIR